MTKRSKTNRKAKKDWNEWETVYESHAYNDYSGDKVKRLRRNKIDGVFGGVCAGIGDYFSLDHTVTRIAFVISVFFLGVPLFLYFLAWIFIPKDKRAPYIREYREARRARKEHPSAPVRTANFRDVKSKFRSLETRLQDLERSITSKEWKLNREFRNL